MAKSNTKFKRRYSRPVEMNKGVICDHTVVLTGLNSSAAYPKTLRRIHYYDSETEKHFNFLTNNFVFSAQTIADLYRYRWQIELFFKWIKQHLRIKSFYGTSENAVKTQIWIAVSIYVLVAIIKKRLKIETSLYNILQVLSLTLFEKISLIQLLDKYNNNPILIEDSIELNLFDNFLGH